MNKFLERLNGGEILVADGATGSNLQKMGLRPGQPPEDLIIDNPDILFKLESSFVEAGSDIILTCTFGGTRMRMKDSKYQDRAPEVNIKAAELARKAASTREGVMVAGSMGPVGGLLKPYGPLDAEDVKATFAEQAKALTEGHLKVTSPPHPKSSRTETAGRNNNRTRDARSRDPRLGIDHDSRSDRDPCLERGHCRQDGGGRVAAGARHERCARQPGAVELGQPEDRALEKLRGGVLGPVPRLVHSGVLEPKVGGHVDDRDPRLQ